MPKVSANTLFHFTHRENLLSILKNNFWPKYCHEFVYTPGGIMTKMAFPMTCFCDLPLYQIGDHIERYGRYGIGLKKEWGLLNNLNPVIYLQKESKLLSKIDSLLLNNWEGVKALQIQPLKNDRDHLIYLWMFCKPYEGRQERNCKIEDIRFYDEREWRHVPDISRLGQDELHLILDESNITMIEQKNIELRQYPLVFSPNDIKYIVIEKEEERLDIIAKIREIKGSKNYSPDEINLLTSRIISVEGIAQDN